MAPVNIFHCFVKVFGLFQIDERISSGQSCFVPRYDCLLNWDKFAYEFL